MMQIQIDEANAKVIKEREAARKAIEEAPPVVKETPVIVQDTEKVDTLTAEVESLKVGASKKLCFFSPSVVRSLNFHRRYLFVLLRKCLCFL